MICKCYSIEHQFAFWYDNEEKELHCEIHLHSNDGSFKRLWHAIKYIFGYKSKYGNWDSMLFEDEDLKDLNIIINEHLKSIE